MDPNACYKRLQDAIVAKDAAEVVDAANDLRRWIDRGGFLPKEFHAHQYERRAAVHMLLTVARVAAHLTTEEPK